MIESDNPKPDNGADPFLDSANAVAQFWMQFATKMATAGLAAEPGSSPPEAARQVRAAVFKAMSEACDEYLRSPEFQQVMKESLSQAVQFRKQLNEWLGQIHHDFQGSSRQDIDQLMQVMRHLEQRMSDSFDRLSARLDAIEQQPPGGARQASPSSTRRAPPSRTKQKRKP